MKCIMFGLACDQNQFNEYINKTSNPYSVAHYLFETKFIEELEKDTTVLHNYILQGVNKKHGYRIKTKCKKITKETTTKYIAYLNLPLVRYMSIFISTCIRIIKYRKKYGKDCYVLSTINYLPIAAATFFMTRLLKYKNIIVFTDCSVGNAYDLHGNIIVYYIKRVYKCLIHYFELKYDKYILFTKAMNELVNKQGKPYCVMEGFFNSNNLDLTSRQKYDKFVILYAGSLVDNMGIENIISSVRMIQNDNMELWIAGEGTIKEKLVELSKGDQRIKFLGYVDRTVLFEMEKRVTLLINIRNPKEEYTKYSFPSKMFEYLASGTPVLSTRLECFPDEYNEYIYFVDDNSTKNVTIALQSILLKSQAELDEFGENAQKFILKNKTPQIQMQKVINFINDEWV